MTNYSRSVLKSNGLHRPENLPVKFGFSPKSTSTNIAKKLPLQHCSKPFLIPPFNFLHKWPTFAFGGESEYTLGSLRKGAHDGSHAETRGFTLAQLCRAFCSPLTLGQRTAGESGCTPVACVRFLRRRSPAGLCKLIISCLICNQFLIGASASPNSKFLC